MDLDRVDAALAAVSDILPRRKADAFVRRVAFGESVTSIAADLGTTRQTIHRWLKDAQATLSAEALRPLGR